MNRDRSTPRKVFPKEQFLTYRQLVTTGLSCLSLAITARVLGPETYGIVAVPLGLVACLAGPVDLGLTGHLARQEPQPQPERALTVHTTMGLAFCGLIWLVAPAVAIWTGQPAVSLLLRWLLPALWLQAVARVPLALLEREQRFAEVGLVETVAEVANAVVAAATVLIFRNDWGVIAGYLLQSALLAGLAYYYQPVSWRWRWPGPWLRAALRESVATAGADWMGRLRGLIPLGVTLLAGFEAAGLIYLTNQIIEHLALLRRVARRMSANLIFQISENLISTRAILGQGMTYQTMLFGPLLGAFAAIAIWIIPLALGPSWLLSVQILPLLAIAALIRAAFDLHLITLTAVGHRLQVAQFHAGHLALLAVVAWLTLPAVGVWGYGLAEILALLSCGLLHRALVQLCGAPKYRDAAWVIGATLPPLLLPPWTPIIGPWLAGALSLTLLIISYWLLLRYRPTIIKLMKTLVSLLRSPR